MAQQTHEQYGGSVRKSDRYRLNPASARRLRLALVNNMRHCVCSAALASLVFAFVCSTAFAQISTGTITGTISDQNGAVIPDAAISVTNTGTGDVRRTSTNSTGDFVVTALNPGKYTIRAEKKGFRQLERQDQVLQANDRLSVGNMALVVGDISEKITVTSQGEVVQTTSSESSQSLTATQIATIQSKARDPISLLRLLPGVSLTGQINSDTLGNNFGTATPNFNGTRNGWNSTSIDGQTESNTFAQATFNGMSSLDSIGEAKIVTANYQAEYGRNSGVFVNFVSKSGTKDFHGNAYWFKRHEQFNANDFFNNRNSVANPRYRYSNYGGTVGGPIFIPGHFNQNRDKLFFFFSGELWNIHYPAALTTLTMPTDLERSGDFSRSLDVSGKVIPVIDPQTRAQFPGNVIPRSRINTDGQSLFKIFPQPNLLDRSITGGNYNYVYARIFDQPKNTELLKVDYNPTDRDRISIRGRDYYSDQQGYGINIGPPWPLVRHHYAFPSHSINGSYGRTITPRLLNEFSFGRRWGGESSTLTSPTEVDFLSRSALGIKLGQLHPENNSKNLIPQFTFGGVPSNPASFTYDDRFPLDQTDHQYEARDNLTYSRGAHIMKFGFLVEQNWTNKGFKGNGWGKFDFGKDSNNPLDSGHGFANALLGTVTSYTEASSRNDNPVSHLLYEWFAQDTWKVTRRLTLDYGMRFSWGTPYTYLTGNAGSFILEKYDPKLAPPLIRPAIDPASGRRVGQNPVTGQYVATPLIGSFAPGVGTIANGLLASDDKSVPNGFRNQQPVQFAPRFGFAYDVTGNGKTAIRGGFGITKEMTLSAHEMVWNNLTHPPVQYNPTIYYTDLNSYLNAGSALFPQAIQGLERKPVVPSLYSYSFNVQHSIGFATVVSAGYVGNVGRHLEQARDINQIPYGARFLAKNADPTNGSPLRDDFFRPYPGLGSTLYVQNSGTSNYNGLQASMTRRFAKGVQFGAAYTWSKSMDITDSDGGVIPTYLNTKTFLYGRAGFDQTHVFVLNYTWDLPKLSRMWNNMVVRQAFDGWQISGVTTFASGFPLGIGYSATDTSDVTGGGDGGRVVVTGKAQLPSGDRSFTQFFNTSVVARPAKGTPGNAPKDVFRGPGFNNWDISGFKNFALLKERTVLQLRGEFYNAFNHTQYAGVNTSARFDATGAQVNGQFGQITSARTARIIQLSLNLRF